MGRNVQKCWFGKCIPSKAQPTPCPGVGNSSFSSPHRGGGSSLPCNAVQCCVQVRTKLHCSPLCLVPALQRSQQELSTPLPGAWLCSKVCAMLCPMDNPLTVQVFSFRLYSSKGKCEFNIRWLHGSSVPPCFPSPFAAPAPQHIPILWGFRAGFPARRDQTCSGVIYFSKYHIS